MNRVAVRTDWDDVRQLAAKGQIARNVDALGGVIAEIGRPVLGVEDEDLLVQILADEVKRGGEIGIATDQGECPHVCRVGVTEHFGRKGHVGFLFLELHDVNELPLVDGITGKTSVVKRGQPCPVLVVLAEEDLDAALGYKCLKIEVLMFNGRGIVRECLDVRREILDGRKDVSLWQESLCKGGEIKPFALRSFSQKTEVEIAGVNVHICLHKDKVPDLANRDPVPLWLNLAAGCRYYRKISFGLQ